MIKKLRESNSREADDFFENDIANFFKDFEDLWRQLTDIHDKIQYFGESGDFDRSDLEYLSRKFPNLVEYNLQHIEFLLDHIKNTVSQFK